MLTGEVQHETGPVIVAGEQGGRQGEGEVTTGDHCLQRRDPAAQRRQAQRQRPAGAGQRLGPVAGLEAQAVAVPPRLRDQILPPAFVPPLKPSMPNTRSGSA